MKKSCKTWLFFQYAEGTNHSEGMGIVLGFWTKAVPSEGNIIIQVYSKTL